MLNWTSIIHVLATIAPIGSSKVVPIIVVHLINKHSSSGLTVDVILSLFLLHHLIPCNHCTNFLRACSSSQKSLVLRGTKLLLEPIDQTDEWVMILSMEMIASWLHLNEFTNKCLVWNVAKNDILGIVIKHNEFVWDLGSCFSFLFI